VDWDVEKNARKASKGNDVVEKEFKAKESGSRLGGINHGRRRETGEGDKREQSCYCYHDVFFQLVLSKV
jgi:hypothetical protein